MGYRIAVVGATGNVGREMLNILEEVDFPVDRLHAIASRRSIGMEIGWKAGVVKCEDIETFDFSNVDIVLMSAGGAISKAWGEKIAAAGPIVIDNASQAGQATTRRAVPRAAQSVKIPTGVTRQAGVGAKLSSSIDDFTLAY